MEIDEKLEQFISNQRKGNRLTLLTVIIFIGLAASTLFFATKLTQSEKSLKAKNDTLLIMKQHLDTIANNSLMMGKSLTLQLSNQKEYYEALIKYTHQQDSINFSSKKKGRPSLDSNANKFRLFNELKPRVYIQYQSAMEDEKTRIIGLLKAKGTYRVPRPEIVELSYDMEIRYFNKEDEDMANDLLNILGKQYHSVFIETDQSPLNQLEVWIGQPQAMNIQQQYDIIKGR